MRYLLYFFHSWLVFVISLRFLRYKPTIKQQITFTAVYGVGVVFSRGIYNFLKVPFGTHTILLIILSIILFKGILEGFTWQKSMYVALVAFIIMLTAEAFAVLPVMKLFDLTITKIETNNTLNMYIGVLSNAVLILVYAILVIRDLNMKQRNFKRYNSGINQQ